ncbi:MAG TPA: type II toxin-antitoxin system VapC family toxin [Solirubrobacterales bacterium]|nr:type II toxin-antitoxin system VapC family toxin [Solirubrobacterales bacterium]
MTPLLDTHLVLWWMAGEASRISKRALAALGSEGVEPIVSAVTIWEAAIKRGLGKLDAPQDLLSQLERAGVEVLPVTGRHADLVASLPLHHRDPFYRLLVAQATLEGLPLVSDDERIRQYEIEVIW